MSVQKTCPDCGAPFGEMERRTMYYNCSLSDVSIKDMEVYPCTGCFNYEVSIPDILGLNGKIARILAVKKESLLPEEITFLRKYSNWNISAMAEVFHVTPEIVARWENGHQKIGPVAERLLRFIAWQGPAFGNTIPTSFEDPVRVTKISLSYVIPTESGWQEGSHGEE